MEKSIIGQQIAGMYNLGCTSPAIQSALNDFWSIFASDPQQLALLDDLEVRYVTSFEISKKEEEHG